MIEDVVVTSIVYVESRAACNSSCSCDHRLLTAPLFGPGTNRREECQHE